MSSISEVKAVIEANFPRLWNPVETCLSVISSLLIKDNANPTSLVLVGPPGSGKTTVLSLFDNLPDITYRSDYFTPKAFLSGKDVSEEELKKIDMLARIDKKCLIVPDFGVTFGKRKEDIAESLAILTRVLDGEGFSIDTGSKGRRTYDGKCRFTLLGAKTNVEHKMWVDMQRFGSRLLFLNMPQRRQSIGELLEEYSGSVNKELVKIQCREAVGKFLTNLWRETGGFNTVAVEDGSIEEDFKQYVLELAQLLGKMRAEFNIPAEQINCSGFINQSVEAPYRTINLLLNIAKGRAIIDEKNIPDEDELPMLIDIVFSSCPNARSLVLVELIREGELCTKDVCELLGTYENNALNIMRGLAALELVDVDGAGAKRFTLSEWVEDLEVFPLLVEHFSKNASSGTGEGDGAE